MKTITISLAAAGAVVAMAPKPVTIPRKNVSSFGVLEDEEVETEDVREEKTSEMYFHAERMGEKTERISLADQTLFDGRLAEAAAMEDIDVAHAMVLALISEYQKIKGEKEDFTPWEYRWDHGEFA